MESLSNNIANSIMGVVQAHTNLIIKAINFAAQKHTKQRRKDEDNSPYINHPISVMNHLSLGGISETDVICAGILHDTIEDTKTTKEELEKEFGKHITNIVLECSDDKSLHKVKRKQLQIEHVKDASTEAKLVKLADKYDNLSGLLTNPPAKWSKAEIHGYGVWCYAVYLGLKGTNKYLEDKLLEVFDKMGIKDLSDEELQKQLDTYYGLIENSE
jgi:(p)ppGpp synthase/HD superfamily hydrolase